MPDSANLGRTTSIKHQNQLVQSYLDSLLSDVTAVAAEETETVSWPEQAQAQQPAEVQLSDHSPAQAAPSKSIDFVESSEAERQQEPQRIEEIDAGSVLSAQAPEIVTETEAVAQGRPEWAEETFASLLFEVALFFDQLALKIQLPFEAVVQAAKNPQQCGFTTAITAFHLQQLATLNRKTELLKQHALITFAVKVAPLQQGFRVADIGHGIKRLLCGGKSREYTLNYR